MSRTLAELHAACLADWPAELPPALRFELEKCLYEAVGNPFVHGFGVYVLRGYYDAHEAELARYPGLASIGNALIDHEGAEDARVFGCVWLTLFPQTDTMRRLAAVLDDPTQPLAVRDQAAWSLGFRQVQARGDIVWPRESVALADAALVRAWERRDALPQLASACRHVAAGELFAAMLSDPLGAVPALEAFCSRELAAVLLESLSAVPDEHAPRVVRLLAACLRDAGALEKAAERATGAVRLELLFAILALAPERGAALLAEETKGFTFREMIDARTAWHLAHPGAFPTVDALRFARVSATVPVSERRALATAACDNFAALAACDGLNQELYWEMWQHCACLAAPAAVVACVAARPSKLPDALALVHLEACAALGRFHAVRAAQTCVDHAIWLLAQHGRPFLALQLAAHHHTRTELACAGEALALFLAGRVDLAALSLSIPPEARVHGERFPGRDEIWRANTQQQPVLRALLTREPAALAALMRPAPVVADSDAIDFAPIVAIEQRLRQASAPQLYLVGTGPRGGAPPKKEKSEMPLQMSFAPLRVAFIAPVLNDLEDARLTMPLTQLAVQVAFEHLFRHPQVAVSDPQYSGALFDNDSDPLSIVNEAAHGLLGRLFVGARRDEILWFELWLGERPRAALKAHHLDGTIDEYNAIGEDLGPMMASCLAQWLQSRELSPCGDLAFSRDDLLQAADGMFNMVGAAQAGDEAAVEEAGLSINAHLAVPALRALLPEVYGPWDDALEARILELSPNHPQLMRDAFFDQLHKTGDDNADRAPIFALIKAAPNWGMPYLSVFGPKIPIEQSMLAQARAVYLMPEYVYARDTLAFQLREDGRHIEAFREWETCTRLSPTFLKGHNNAMIALGQAGKFARALEDGTRRWVLLEEWAQSDAPSEFDRNWIQGFSFVRAETFHDVGQLQEAIAMFDRAMEMHGTRGEFRVKQLAEWKDSANEIALAYAREGFYAGEPGRVLDGFGKARLAWGSDVAAWMHALTVSGHERLVPLAYSHLRGTGLGNGSAIRLSAALGRLHAGLLGEVLVDLFIASTRAPQENNESELQRILRAAAARPLGEWEAVITSWAHRGARHVAAHIARDAADFVPGADASEIVKQALPEREAITFAPEMIASLREMVGEVATPIDAFFARECASLADADKLVAEWPQLVHGEHADVQVGYIAVQAMCRYLALTTAAPNVQAGAWRTIAGEVLNDTRLGEIPNEAFRAVLEAFEAVSVADTWTFDTWLLRMQRAMDLENRVGAHIRGYLESLPTVTSLLRGDERVALEWQSAEDQKANPALQDNARQLFERCVRAVGMGRSSLEWSKLAVLTLPPAEALDVHWTAALLNFNNATPSVNAARELLAQGRGAEAFDVLCSGFPPAGKEWREKQIQTLQPQFAAAKFPVAGDFASAANECNRLLQAGQFEQALPHARWCAVLDSKNAVAQKNLGLCYARLGRPREAAEAYTRADRALGLRWAGQALVEASKHRDALDVFALAALVGLDADGYKLAAVASWYEEADVEGAAAYGELEKLRLLDLSELNGYATALNGAGEFARAEVVANKVLAQAPDATYKSCGHHALARALLGQGGDGVSHAEEAVKLNPLPDNTAEFAETLRRCKAHEPYPPKTEKSVAEKAFAQLRDYDFHAAQATAAHALEVNNRDFAAWRALLAASQPRSAADLFRPAAAATKIAKTLLTVTAGKLDPQAMLARAEAQRVRELGVCPPETLPAIGTRLSREEFRERFAAADAAAAPAKPYDAGQQMAAAQKAAIQMQDAAVADADPVVFPGAKLAKLSDYVGFMKAMQTSGINGALEKYGLSMMEYGTVAGQWGQKMMTDAVLVQQFSKQMAG